MSSGSSASSTGSAPRARPSPGGCSAPTKQTFSRRDERASRSVLLPVLRRRRPSSLRGGRDLALPGLCPEVPCDFPRDWSPPVTLLETERPSLSLEDIVDSAAEA